ncbi:Bacterocin transport accessory protein [Streptococcus sp. DD10]|uniref:PedC/BrcD family bacteriocin maturation disulfide isomerase n=1 Tax=Streptococcus sp. DD10 TaxID=1777878 RepID=UPI00079BA424|nr:PedC/BrcD family bacteriocin maturation disulfide isomerase [Streptococcus sp. DD10]KXT75111.1 Bacterocin transport accessory protein [Streptococcus sp. DD10]
MNEFAKHIEALEVTTVTQARKSIENKETATFFIGRATCPYCRRFATTLAGVVAETKAHIYFINSEETSELTNLQEFRKEFDIPTVPGFLHTENGNVSVRCDSGMTASEITAFAHLV